MKAGELRAVVRAHVKDLRACAPVLRAHGLDPSAAEFEKAAAELEAALAQEVGPTQRELSMAMMIRMLCSHTANASTRKRAMDLLERNGLQGSPLR